MANSIIDILPQSKVLNQETTNNSDKEISKDKPSLFDSLLKGANQASDGKEVSEPKEPEKKDILNDTSVIQNTNESKEDLNSKITDKTQSSLLDKLVIEAKKEIKDSGVEVSKTANKNEETVKVDSSIILDSQILEDSNKSKGSEKKDIVNDTSVVQNTNESKEDLNSKVADKTQSSLLDKLVIEAKKEIKDSGVKVSKTANKNEETVKVDSSVILDSQVAEESDKLKDSEKKDIVLGSSNTSVVQNIDESKEDLNSNTADKTQSSLLDKLVIEVKKEIKDSSVEVSQSTINSSLVKVSEEVVNLNEKELIKTTTTVVKNSNDETVKENTVLVNTTLNTSKNDKNKSLMDLLIQKNTQAEQSLGINDSLNLPSESSNNEFISTIYLGSQKNVLNNQLLFNKNEAVNILKTSETIQDIEKGANLLDLGLDSVSVEQTETSALDIKKQEVDLLSKRTLLDKLLSEKNVKSEEIKNLITQSKEASSALLDNSLTINDNDNIVNVNSPLAYNIQSKIIGAKQQMSTMMSDIARQMYENYKPPVTVFKINLNPLELGSISILMKNDKNNALSISMNISNTTTLNVMMENQNILKNALSSTFNESTSFNLDFSSGQNSSQSSNKEQNQQNRKAEERVDTQTILQMKEENKEEKIIDYM